MAGVNRVYSRAGYRGATRERVAQEIDAIDRARDMARLTRGEYVLLHPCPSKSLAWSLYVSTFDAVLAARGVGP